MFQESVFEQMFLFLQTNLKYTETITDSKFFITLHLFDRFTKNYFLSFKKLA